MNGEQPDTRRVIRPAPTSSPWLPASYEKADISAVQAMACGIASPDQQKRALDWIIHQVAATYDMPYRPGGQDGERDSCFAAGKMYVGQQIIKALKMNLGAIPNREPRADAHEPRS